MAGLRAISVNTFWEGDFMLRRSATLGLAVSAVLASAGLVRAGEPSSAASSFKHPIYAADEAAKKPLMSTLDKTGMGGPLENAGINIYGHVEGGWTYNIDRPNTQTNVGRIFDFEDQDKTLNQVDLTIEKTTDATKGTFDWGFKVEAMYGADARLIHSNGLNFYGPEYAANSAAEHPTDPGTADFDHNEEFDLTQAYGQVALPVGSGLTITAGKFVTLLGYETINPTMNMLYSHSYLFGYAIPFTQTGGMAKYNITKDVSLTLGFSRGWEQTNHDNNGSIDGFGQLSWNVNDKLSIAVNAICGPEQANDSSHYRTVIDVTATYKMGDNTTLGMNADYGYGSREGSDVGFGGTPGTGDWWGAAVYFQQVFDPHVSLNVRAEYFNDDDGCRGLGTSVEELTVGLAIKPMPDNQWASGLVFRPEVRWDHADDQIFNDGAGDENQFTVGGDIIFAF